MKKRGVYIDPLWAAFLMVGVALGLLIGGMRTAKAAERTVVAVEPVVKVVEMPVRETKREPEFALAEPPVAETPVEVEESPLESLGVFKITAYCT